MKETFIKIGQVDTALRTMLLMLEIGLLDSKKTSVDNNYLIFFSSILERTLKTQLLTMKAEDFSESRMQLFVKKNPLQIAKNPNGNRVEKMSTDQFYSTILVSGLLDLTNKREVTYEHFTYLRNPVTGRFSHEPTHWDMNVSREKILKQTENLQTTVMQLLAQSNYVEKEPQNVLKLGHFVANILQNYT